MIYDILQDECAEPKHNGYIHTYGTPFLHAKLWIPSGEKSTSMVVIH